MESFGSPFALGTGRYAGATSRIQSISYPNGQMTNLAYFPITGDRRLQEINNQNTGRSKRTAAVKPSSMPTTSPTIQRSTDDRTTRTTDAVPTPSNVPAMSRHADFPRLNRGNSSVPGIQGTNNESGLQPELRPAHIHRFTFATVEIESSDPRNRKVTSNQRDQPAKQQPG